MNVKDFYCNANLSQYVDSMLFDSGECIATMECEIDGIEISISLDVRGEVEVYVGEDSRPYKYPSEFPPALRESIKRNPGWWDCDDDIFIEQNNWFEYIYTVKGEYEYTDGVMCEWDISKGAPEDIQKEMIEICNWIAENNTKLM